MQRKELTIMEKVDRANKYITKSKHNDFIIYGLFLTILLVCQVCLLLFCMYLIDIAFNLR